MTQRMIHALLVVALAGAVSCTTEAIPDDGDDTPDGEWTPDPAPSDDAPDLSISEPGEPNDIGDSPGAFELPAVGEAPVTLRGCIEPRDRDGDGDPEADRDAFQFEVDGPGYIDVSIEGSGDALAGFLVESEDADLAGDGWLRVAADPGAPAVRRRVFLPKAGRYFLVASDSRTIISGVPMGNRTACYRAQVRQLELPFVGHFSDSTADATNGDPRFYRYLGDTGRYISFGKLWFGHPGAIGSVVVMRNGEYFSSAATVNGIATTMMPPHGWDDEIVLVADSVFRVLPGTDYEVSVEGTELVADPGDGSPVVFEPDTARQAVELYFYAELGELVNLRFLSDGWKYDVSVVRPDKLGTIAEICEWCAASSSTWISIRNTGLHHIRVLNHNAPAGSPFNVAFTRTHLRPMSVEVGSEAAGDLHGADRAWYILHVNAGDTLGFSVEPSGGDSFAEAEVRMYDAAIYGQIDHDNPFTASVPLWIRSTSSGEPFVRMFYESKRVLLSVANSRVHQGDESFELVITRQN